MKNKLAKIKLSYIQKNAPFEFTHWNEDKYFIKFYGINQPSVFIKKPFWMQIIERILYEKFTGKYKDNPILSLLICGAVGLMLGFIGGWMV